MITEKAVQIEEIWGAVSGRAVRALRRRGIGLAQAEDAVQEAVTRAIAKDVRFDDIDHLLPWIHTVAWRIVLDTRKHESRLVYDVPECSSTDETARTVEARMRLERLRELLRTLTPADHDALHCRCGADTTRAESVRCAVRRHRVRRQLLLLLDGLAAVIGWLRYAGPRRPTRSVAAMLAPMVILSTGVVLLPRLAEAPPRPLQRPQVRAADAPVTTAPLDARIPARRERPLSADGPARRPATYPEVEVEHPGVIGDGSVRGAPKAPGDHFVCVDWVVVGARCADLPVRVTG